MTEFSSFSSGRHRCGCLCAVDRNLRADFTKVPYDQSHLGAALISSLAFAVTDALDRRASASRRPLVALVADARGCYQRRVRSQNAPFRGEEGLMS